MTYKERISETVFSLFAIEKSETVFSLFEKEPPFIVSWSHYLQLMRIENEDERSFYEIESAKSGWAVRTLQRQYNSSLYERLALSRDKNGVLRLAKEGNVDEHAMYNTYNMGIGMIVAVDPADVDKTIEAIKATGDTPYVIGHIEDGEKGVTLC